MTREAPPGAGHALATSPEEARRTIDTLFRDHARQVARWAARLAGPSIEAEDIVQEVFLISQQRLHTFNGTAKPTTWLFGITSNVVRHRRRRERMRQLLAALTIKSESTVEPQPGPAEQLERREANRVLYQLIDQMRESYRNLFILFELEGMSGEEIAALTGLRPATVRVRLHRARAQFLQLFERSGPQLRKALRDVAMDPNDDEDGMTREPSSFHRRRERKE